MATHEPWLQRLQRKAPRLRKYCHHSIRRIVRGDAGPERRLVFVLGAQRSGTRLPLVVMDRCPDMITFNEGSSAFFNRVMLRPDDEVRSRLRHIPVPIVVLKPICESHRAVELLESFPASRAIWIYRGYRAVTRSATAKWGTAVRHLHSLAAGMKEEAAWRTGGMTPEKEAFVREVYSPDMSLDAANAVFWYLRTSLYLDLKLQARPDVLLVKYEDLARQPGRFFPRMFEFLDCDFDGRYLETVRPSSESVPELKDVPPRIVQACEDLERRMGEVYGRAILGERGGRVVSPASSGGHPGRLESVSPKASR
jgi:hypothetical protein